MTSVTTALIASYEEAVEAGGWLVFPVLAMPFGAEVYGTRSRLLASGSEITPEVIEGLLAESAPLNGVQKLHLISVATSGDAPWKHLLTRQGPRIDVDYH